MAVLEAYERMGGGRIYFVPKASKITGGGQRLPFRQAGTSEEWGTNRVRLYKTVTEGNFQKREGEGAMLEESSSSFVEGGE